MFICSENAVINQFVSILILSTGHCHSTTSAGAKCTEAHTHTLIQGEVLGVFRRDSVRCRRGWVCEASQRALGDDHLSLPCVRVSTHDVNDCSVTVGATCRTWDVYVRLVSLKQFTRTIKNP